MGRYLIRRALFMVLVLFVVSLLTFLIFVKLPAGDPARRAVGRSTTPEQIEAARKAFGLDKPLYVQYGRFAKGLIPWPGLFLDEDVYYSYGNFVPVKEEIYRRLPVTVTLGGGRRRSCGSSSASRSASSRASSAGRSGTARACCSR